MELCSKSSGECHSLVVWWSRYLLVSPVRMLRGIRLQLLILSANLFAL